MRSLYARSFSNGAREAQIIVTSRARRWTTMPSMVSAIEEQVVQPASYVGPNMKVVDH